MEPASRGRFSSESGRFSSESVSEGHPDRLCDAIADWILDSVIANDPDGGCATKVA